MRAIAARSWLAALGLLAVLGCLIGVTGMALFAVQHTQWDWLSLLLGAALILLITVLIWLVLDGVDDWIDRAECKRAGEKP